MTSKSLGNPIFDHLYHSFQKFGPHSDFIGCPGQNNIYVYSNGLAESNSQNLRKYFNKLGLKNVFYTPFSNFEGLISSDESILGLRKLQMILLGRVSIHLATIENSTLVPLRDGVNISDQIAENLIIS